jgi:hypothetical protein
MTSGCQAGGFYKNYFQSVRVEIEHLRQLFHGAGAMSCYQAGTLSRRAQVTKRTLRWLSVTGWSHQDLMPGFKQWPLGLARLSLVSALPFIG